jgi:hypothetical protein
MINYTIRGSGYGDRVLPRDLHSKFHTGYPPIPVAEMAHYFGLPDEFDRWKSALAIAKYFKADSLTDFAEELLIPGFILEPLLLASKPKKLWPPQRWFEPSEPKYAPQDLARIFYVSLELLVRRINNFLK